MTRKGTSKWGVPPFPSLTHHKFVQQRIMANHRGIPFLMSYDEWLHVWISSGHAAERGRLGHQYCMSRLGDLGPYQVGNVVIKTNKENLAELIARKKIHGCPALSVAVKKSWSDPVHKAWRIENWKKKFWEKRANDPAH